MTLPLFEGLTQNPLFQGGFVLGLMGTAVTLAKSTFSKYWSRAFSYFRFSTELEVSVVVNWYFDNHHTDRRINVMNTTWDYTRQKNGTYVYTPRLRPKTGSFKILHEGKRIFVSFSSEKANKESTMEVRKIHLARTGRNSRKIVESFLKHMTDAYNASLRTDTVPVMQWTSQNGWVVVGYTAKRSKETVIDDNNTIDMLATDIRQFLAKKDWYLGLGVPFRRGYILYGPPGNGKTTLVRTLASELNMTICRYTSEQMMKMDVSLSSLPGNSILLIEDVDATLLGMSSRSSTILMNEEPEPSSGDKKEDAPKKRTASFSEVLNSIDGVMVSDSPRIIIMTTNHIEHLDPALIRPGRIDRRILVDNASRQQLVKLYLKFFPGDTDGAERFSQKYKEREISMAAAQGELFIMMRDTVTEALQPVEFVATPPTTVEPTPVEQQTPIFRFRNKLKNRPGLAKNAVM